MLSPSQLKALLKTQKLGFKKSLGQNFLIDKRHLEKILGSLDITKDDIVVEIGAGLGAITQDLSRLCRRLIAVEIDKGLCRFLSDLFKDKNIDIACKDILKFDFKDISEKFNKKIKVVGNLPYYITSPIIIYLINNRRYIDTAFITVQKEVAERLISPPNKKSYGSLSCFVQFYTKPTILVRIPKEAFFPKPEVSSAFLKLQFLEKPTVKTKDEILFFKIINAAFNKRRKTIINAISMSAAFNIDKERLAKILLDAGVNPDRRGETLSLDEFAQLTEHMEVLKSG